MIQHILLFRFHENTPAGAIDKIMNKFLECREKLLGFIDMQHGPNASTKRELSKGLTYGVIMTFTDKEAIAKYNELDEHKEAQQLQKPYVKEVLVFDIEELT